MELAAHYLEDDLGSTTTSGSPNLRAAHARGEAGLGTRTGALDCLPGVGQALSLSLGEGGNLGGQAESMSCTRRDGGRRYLLIAAAATAPSAPEVADRAHAFDARLFVIVDD